ncbi:MAG TPA: GDSL-type esterase/lipase family protein [Pyrinomonadaceae bacterium]|nr:GDSL-type esterase/lipase family protein [Pyrinomonadaceae bacterium]
MKNGLTLAASLLALVFAAGSARAQTAWQYTALGDSLAAGIDDTQGGGYVPRFRNHVQQDAGVAVNLVNRGVPGWTSDDLLNALRTDQSLRAQVAASRVVTFNIGGNDVLGALQRYQSGTCGGADNQQCFAETVARFKSNWNAIVAQLLSLRSTSDTVIRTMDVYNPVVGLLKLNGVFDQTKPYLDDLNRHIFLTAVANRIPCARVYREFNGPNGDQDAFLRGLIASDQIHPNAAGHEAIARTLRALSYRPLAGPVTTVQFVLPIFVAVERDPRANVTLSRFDTTGAAFVDFSTADDPGDVPCSSVNGTSYARCDFATTVETLYFEPGEGQKTVTVPLVNDSYVEGTERFQIRVDNEAGGNILLRTTAQVQIQDEDGGTGPHPLNDHTFFVRQHYLDFLSREPEASGLQAWLNVLNNCPQPFNHDPAAASALCDRNLVSSAFFRSPEFEIKGFFVYKLYAATLGRVPRYEELIADMRRVTGETADEVLARRGALANSWVERQEFRVRYPSTLSDAEFVNKLVETAGVTLTGAVTRESLVSELQQRTKTRSEVVAALAEHPAVTEKFFRPAFVTMQYAGYLRRTAEQTGFDDWLKYLNQNPQDYYTMVNGFLYSQEYALRFGTEGSGSMK